MNTNLSFLKHTTHIFFLATVTLLLLSAPSATFAGTATWDSSGSTDWDTNANWTPNTGYPGTGVGDTATFNNLSSVNSVFVSADTSIAAIDFTASETHQFTITVNDNLFQTLTLSGSGITNSSGRTQFFVLANTGNGSFMNFDGTNATAGSMTQYTVVGGATAGAAGGVISFNGSSSTAASATFINQGGTATTTFGGSTQFEGSSSTAGTATFTNNPGSASGGGGGFTEFDNTSSADHAMITNNGGAVKGAFGLTVFGDFGDSTAGTAATAANATIINNGGTGSNADGGETDFVGNNAGTIFSTAGNSTITNNAGTFSGVGGSTGGLTDFANASTAGSATITNNGGTASGEGGGETLFENTSTASGATLIANGGTGGGGGGFIVFNNDSTGGTARVEVFGNGYLDIHLHNAPGVTIGSLEGSGNAFLGNRNLTVGSLNTSTTFSGVIQDGAPGGGGLTGGSLTKTGTGTLALTGANTYTGATTISGGTLQLGNGGITGTLSTSSTITNNANFTINRSNAVVQGTDFSGSAISGTGSFTQAGTGTTTLTAANTYTGVTTVNAGTLLVNGSTSSSSAVTVNNSGTTLGGTGTIGGTVTVNSGANLSPGTSPGILNTGSVTLNSGSNLRIDINGPTVGTQYDQLNVTGTVTLTGSNLVITVGGTLTVGEQFTIINNDLSDAVVGTFAQGSSVSSGGNTFSIDYAGGTNNNDVVLTVTTAAPEPSTWLGGALVFAALAYTQRRRFARMLRHA